LSRRHYLISKKRENKKRAKIHIMKYCEFISISYRFFE
jgi:hypothetical protein